MITNSLSNRLSYMLANYSMEGNLGPNTAKSEITDQDYLTLGGMGFMISTFPEMDGSKEDLNPAAGKLRVPGHREGDEIVAHFKINKASQSTMARVEAVEGPEHYAWFLGMDESTTTLVILEDKGETFKATGLTLLPDESKSSKVVRTGTWDELPEGIVFGG